MNDFEHTDFANVQYWKCVMLLVASMLLYVFDDLHSRHGLLNRHVLPSRVVMSHDQVTMLFDDDYDQHNMDDPVDRVELPSQMVAKF